LNARPQWLEREERPQVLLYGFEACDRFVHRAQVRPVSDRGPAAARFACGAR
jgi:hypothetical protein